MPLDEIEGLQKQCKPSIKLAAKSEQETSSKHGPQYIAKVECSCTQHGHILLVSIRLGVYK